MRSFITKHALLLLLLHGAKQEDREAGRQRQEEEGGGRGGEKNAAGCCSVALQSRWVKSPPQASPPQASFFSEINKPDLASRVSGSLARPLNGLTGL